MAGLYIFPAWDQPDPDWWHDMQEYNREGDPDMDTALALFPINPDDFTGHVTEDDVIDYLTECFEGDEDYPDMRWTAPHLASYINAHHDAREDSHP